MAPLKSSKKSGMVVIDKEDLVDRIASHKGVEGVIVATREGMPLKTSLDSTATAHYLDGLIPIERRCVSMVREIEPLDEVLYIRLTSGKYHVSMAPRPDHLALVIQRRTKD